MSDNSDPTVLPLWLTFFATFLLAVVAALQDRIRDCLKKPRIVVAYRPESPMFRLSAKRFLDRELVAGACFDIHLMLTNEGGGEARNVQVNLEKIFRYNYDNGRLEAVPDFWPARLRYDTKDTRSVSLIPHSPAEPWNLGFIPSPGLTDWLRSGQYVDAPGVEGDWTRLYLDLLDRPFFQPSVLGPGIWVLKVSVYSENGRRVDVYLKIAWTGNWRDDVKQMLDEFRLELLNAHPKRCLSKAIESDLQLPQ